MLPGQSAEFLRHKGSLRSGVNFLDDGVAGLRIEVRRADDDAVNVGGSIATFGGEPFRHGPTGGQESGDVGAFQFQHLVAVDRAAQFSDGRLIHPGPGVEEPTTVRRKLDLVGAVALGEYRQPSAIQIHPREVQVVRILPGSNPARKEPDLLAFFIDVFDRAHHPVALRDRVLHGAGGDVDAPQVAPTAAFGHPQEFAARVQPVTPGLGGPVHHGFRSLLDHSAHLAGAVDGQDPVHLMPPLVVVDVEFLTVRGPLDLERAILGEGVGIEGWIHIVLTETVHRKDPEKRAGQGVARFGVGVGMHLGLELILGSSLDPRDVSGGGLTNPSSDEVGRILRPVDLSVVGIIPSRIPADAHSFSTGLGSEEHVSLPHFDGPFSVRRILGIGFGGRGFLRGGL